MESRVCGTEVEYRVCGTEVEYRVCGTEIEYRVCGTEVEYIVCVTEVEYRVCGTEVVYRVCGTEVAYILHQVKQRKPIHDHEVWSSCFSDSFNYLKREPHPVLVTSSPLIFAMIGVVHKKLVE